MKINFEIRATITNFAQIERKRATMKVKIRSFKDTDTSLLGLVEQSLKQNWDQPAYSDYGTDNNYTFGDVAKNVARLHAIFKKIGIQPGDKIALCDKNSSHWAISFIAILSYGTVVVPILSDFHTDQILNIYKHSESRLMICSLKTAKSTGIKDVMDIEDLTLINSDMNYAIEEFKDLKPENVNFFREDPEGLALISYTSGSTGRSKGVMLPYRSIWSNVIFADEVLGLPKHCRTMAILPMAHMYGFAFDFIYEFCIGAHVHYLTKTPSPAVVIKAFGEIKPAIVIAVPLIIEKIVTGKVFPILRTAKMKALTKLPVVRNIIYNKIRQQLVEAFGGAFYEVIIGGAAFSKEVEDFLAKINFPYTVGYGMTECGPIIGYEDWHDFAKGSCGKPAPRMTVKIDSKNPETTPGEIITKGTNVMLGYYKNPEETAEAIDSDGWLHTGDLGTMDKDGNIFIRGRKKTMLLGANGQNIYPEEIEDIILSNSIFDECIVVQRGEKLVALAYVSDDSLKKLGMNREQLSNNLDAYKKEVNIVLPKFANIIGFELQEQEFEKTPKRSIRRYIYK